MDPTAEILLYLLSSRFLILFIAGLSLAFGYRLFRSAIVEQRSASMTADVHGLKFSLRNAAPGTCFAAFGAIIVAIMLVQSSPSVTFRIAREARASIAPAGERALGSPPAPSGAEVVTYRGNSPSALENETNIGKEFERNKEFASAERHYARATESMAEPMNDLAWAYFQRGRLKEALALARLAVTLSPDEPRFSDTLAKVASSFSGTRSPVEGPERTR